MVFPWNKPSILGYPHFRKPPNGLQWLTFTMGVANCQQCHQGHVHLSSIKTTHQTLSNNFAETWQINPKKYQKKTGIPSWLMIRISAKKSHGLQKLSIIGSSRCHRTSSNCLEAPCAVSLGPLGVAQTCGRPQNRYDVFPTSNANVGFLGGRVPKFYEPHPVPNA